MAGGWWDGVGKAIDIVSALAGSGKRSADEDGTLQPRGVMGGIEARLAGVLVSALHEAFARDAARMDAEREHASAERERAERALRMEIARQEADRQTGQLRALVAIDVVVWLASLVAVVIHPPAGLAAKTLLAAAWLVLVAGIGAAFVAYGRVSQAAAAGLVREAAASEPPRVLSAASWLTVSGFGLAAASVIALMV